jgi:hypothetical protein
MGIDAADNFVSNTFPPSNMNQYVTSSTSCIPGYASASTPEYPCCDSADNPSPGNYCSGITPGNWGYIANACACSGATDCAGPCWGSTCQSDNAGAGANACVEQTGICQANGSCTGWVGTAECGVGANDQFEIYGDGVGTMTDLGPDTWLSTAADCSAYCLANFSGKTMLCAQTYYELPAPAYYCQCYQDAGVVAGTADYAAANCGSSGDGLIGY